MEVEPSRAFGLRAMVGVSPAPGPLARPTAPVGLRSNPGAQERWTATRVVAAPVWDAGEHATGRSSGGCLVLQCPAGPRHFQVMLDVGIQTQSGATGPRPL